MTFLLTSLVIPCKNILIFFACSITGETWHLFETAVLGGDKENASKESETEDESDTVYIWVSLHCTVEKAIDMDDLPLEIHMH